MCCMVSLGIIERCWYKLQYMYNVYPETRVSNNEKRNLLIYTVKKS
jgi:hypothetical protein